MKVLQKPLNEQAVLCFLALLFFFYILFKLPIDLSVIFTTSNEAIYFIYGQFFLDGNGLRSAGGHLFTILYAVVLKLFGFGTGSIIAIHFLHTVTIISIGITIYLLIRRLLNNSFWAGLTTLFWFLFQVTPIGKWGNEYELETSFCLEAEYFCVLTSLLSMYLILCALNSKKTKLLSLSAGLLALSSAYFDTGGAVLFIAIFLLTFYFICFDRVLVNNIKYDLAYFFIGFFLGLLLINLFVFFVNRDISLAFGSFLPGIVYSTDFMQSPGALILRVFDFMTRFSGSISNLLLFSIMFLLIAWCFVRNSLFKENRAEMKLYVPLLSIWSIGNICVVLAPGHYSSYYYILVWPSVAILLVLGLKDLFTHVIPSSMNLKIITLVFMSIFFLYRLFVVMPDYFKMLKRYLDLNIVYQPQSFQDPVLPGTKNPKRNSILLAADLFNSLLPDKKDTIYLFTFDKYGFLFPQMYVYAKRLPPTTLLADYLQYPAHLSKISRQLVQDLTNYPPKIFVSPKTLYVNERMINNKDLKYVFEELDKFLKKNYHLEAAFNDRFFPGAELETYQVYERNKKT